jgi:hypothetical protein
MADEKSTSTSKAGSESGDLQSLFDKAEEQGYFGLDAEDLGADPTDDTLSASDDDRSNAARPDSRASFLADKAAEAQKAGASK